MCYLFLFLIKGSQIVNKSLFIEKLYSLTNTFKALFLTLESVSKNRRDSIRLLFMFSVSKVRLLFVLLRLTKVFYSDMKPPECLLRANWEFTRLTSPYVGNLRAYPILLRNMFESTPYNASITSLRWSKRCHLSYLLSN